MKKKDLLKILDKALRIEEDAVRDYSRDIISTMNWSRFTDDEKKEISVAMKKLAEDSKRHREIVLNLIQKVEKGGKDVY